MQMGAVGGGGVGGAVPMMMNNPYQNSDIFKDLIANEMVSVLNSVLAEMRMTNPMTLEELSVMNPALFAQIRGKAEQNTITIMQRRMMQQQQQQPVQAQQNQYVSNSAASVNNVGYPTNNGRYLPPQQQQRAIPQQQQYQQEIASSQHYASHSQPQPRPHYNGGGRQGMNNKRSVAEVYAQPQAVEQYPPSLASNVPPVNQGNIMATQPVEFVNGFMCETPAIISVSRLQTLSQRLNNCTNDLLAQFSPRIGMMSGRLSQRLQDYVPVLMQPPPLPDILTGSQNANKIQISNPNVLLSFFPSLIMLDGRFFSNVNSAPQQPILQNTVATTSHVKASAAQGNNGMMRFQPPPPPRMSKPEFKLLDFDRQPELKSRALRNLYEGRPHQCFEDGLRFTNLQQLRQHTDGILERKKLMKKKSDRKEPQNREWFCTLPQWITNFQSKVLGATGADVTSSGQPGGSSSGATVASAVIAEAAEEFVIPADENFTRCPISGEVFQAIWDDEEGEMMYRNAVKVLLPPGSEPNLYHMARPVDGAGASTGIKYMIVHKLFVVDKWLQERKAMPLSDLPTEELLTQQLKEAAGEEDAEDIFVLLNQSLRF